MDMALKSCKAEIMHFSRSLGPTVEVPESKAGRMHISRSLGNIGRTLEVFES